MPAKFSETEAKQRREEILEAAGGVFARKGFEATTVRDLEEATGLSRGGIFFHFPSKEEIYKAAIQRCSLAGAPFVASRVQGATTAPEALLAVFNAVHEWHREHPEAMAFFQQITMRKETDPEFVELDADISASMNRFIAGQIRELQGRGVFDEAIDADGAALLMHGVLDHLISETLGMDPAQAEEHVRPMLDALTNGVAPRAAASTGS